MNEFEIKNADDIYQLVNRLKVACKQQKKTDFLQQLDHSLNLGSSGLEIMGSIRKNIIENRNDAENLLGENGKKEIADTIHLINKFFGVAQ